MAFMNQCGGAPKDVAVVGPAHAVEDRNQHRHEVHRNAVPIRGAKAALRRRADRGDLPVEPRGLYGGLDVLAGHGVEYEIESLPVGAPLHVLLHWLLLVVDEGIGPEIGAEVDLPL